MADPFKLPNVRLSFPDLFEARAFKEGDTPKFKASFLIPKNSVLAKAVDKEIERVATAKWGAKAATVLKGIRQNPNKFCFQDGDTKSYDGYEGMMCVSAANKIRPTVIDRDKSQLVQADGKPYAGCYVNAQIEFFAYTNSGNGISASLSGVQFVKDGDAFSGGQVASPEDFDDLSDGADEVLA